MRTIPPGARPPGKLSSEERSPSLLPAVRTPLSDHPRSQDNPTAFIFCSETLGGSSGNSQASFAVAAPEN